MNEASVSGYIPSRGALAPWEAAFKRALDLSVASVAVVLLSPLLLVLALGISLTSSGGIFYRQTRHGLDKRRFDIWKFRSMYVDQCDHRSSNRINQAVENDPRVTPIGRFIRRTSLDELPQIFNVLAGDMSLVGPRPHAIAEDEYFSKLVADYEGRFRVKPGITGLAQIEGCRGEITSVEFMQSRIQKDNEYVEGYFPMKDLIILVRTPLALLGSRGAY